MRAIWNGSGRQVLSLGLPHSARREGADGSVALATVFSGALGFRIGGVAVMPLRLVLAHATMIGATHGFRKGAPESLLDYPLHGLIVPPSRLSTPRSAPDEQSLGRAGPVGQLLAGGRGAPLLIVEVLRPGAKPPLALSWVVERSFHT